MDEIKVEKATKSSVKYHNKMLVFRTIYENEPSSRAEIARKTRLTRAAVSEIVRELLQEGWIYEGGVVSGRVGKPPTLLRIAEDGRCFIGVDLSNEQYRGALFNLRGRIQHQVDWPLQAPQGEGALAHVFELIDALWAAATAPVLGIGVGTPGVVDIEEGIVHQAVNRGWENLPLKALLSRRYGVPVYVANDSHMTALAEYRFGVREGIRNLVAIKIGEGIGAGVVLEGRLLGGDSHAAGEIGHLVVVESGEVCTCGNRGCLETVASVRALLRQARRRIQEHPDSRLAALCRERGTLGLGEIREALEQGDAVARGLVEEAGRALGIAIAATVSVLDVEHVVICGEGASLGAPFLNAAAAEARRRILSRVADRLQIRLSTLGKEAVMLGASAMIMAQVLHLR